MTKLFRRLTGAFACLLLAAAALAQQPFIVVASTTSTEQSGLFPQLLPAFEKDTGINVRVVAVGTGQALDIGRRGDADVVFVHDKTAELKWLAEGEGVRRYPVMYNDFVLVGPASDPARVKGSKDITTALKAIADAGVPVVGIAVRDRPEALARFLARNGNAFRAIGADDASQVQMAMGSSGVPESFVVDGKGRILSQVIGPINPQDVASLIAEVKAAR